MKTKLGNAKGISFRFLSWCPQPLPAFSIKWAQSVLLARLPGFPFYHVVYPLVYWSAVNLVQLIICLTQIPIHAPPHVIMSCWHHAGDEFVLLCWYDCWKVYTPTFASFSSITPTFSWSIIDVMTWFTMYIPANWTTWTSEKWKQIQSNHSLCDHVS